MSTTEPPPASAISPPAYPQQSLQLLRGALKKLFIFLIGIDRRHDVPHNLDLSRKPKCRQRIVLDLHWHKHRLWLPMLRDRHRLALGRDLVDQTQAFRLEQPCTHRLGLHVSPHDHSHYTMVIIT